MKIIAMWSTICALITFNNHMTIQSSSHQKKITKKIKMNAKTIAFYFCFLLFEMVSAHTRHNALEMSEKQNEISFAFGWKFFGQTREFYVKS